MLAAGVTIKVEKLGDNPLLSILIGWAPVLIIVGWGSWRFGGHGDAASVVPVRGRDRSRRPPEGRQVAASTQFGPAPLATVRETDVCVAASLVTPD